MNEQTAATISRLSHGDRIAVRVHDYRGRLSEKPDSFTVGSVAGYAAEYDEDPAAAVRRARQRGEALYYAFNEGVTITAHRQEPVERQQLELGDLVEMDRLTFRIEETSNRQIKLTEVAQTAWPGYGARSAHTTKHEQQHQPGGTRRTRARPAGRRAVRQPAAHRPRQ